MKRKVYLERLIVSDKGIFSNCRLLSSVVYISQFTIGFNFSALIFITSWR